MRNKHVSFFIALSFLTGCLDTSGLEDADAIADAIELENGGLEMTDEAPAFGDAAAFEDVSETDAVEYEEVDDAIDRDADVVDMRDRPDAAQVNLFVLWGQIPGNPENERPKNWSGSFSVNRGAMVVRRLVRFEDRTDHLLPRDDRKVVPFTSVTLPHNDGMVLTIIDPTPEVDQPLTFTYTSNPERDVTDARNEFDVRPAIQETVTVEVEDLLNGRVELLSDDAGNRMLAAAIARPIDVCDRGFLAGRWHKVRDGRGRLLGKVTDDEGRPIGHIRGIFGVRRNGEHVFFGKYINLEGEFKGIFKGEYGDGSFKGRWLHRSGDHGVLGGHYRESLPGPEVGGHFAGRWAETSCNLDI